MTEEPSVDLRPPLLGRQPKNKCTESFRTFLGDPVYSWSGSLPMQFCGSNRHGGPQPTWVRSVSKAQGHHIGLTKLGLNYPPKINEMYAERPEGATHSTR